MEGSRYGLCGTFGSESILVRVQTGRDDVSDVLENQFLKLLYQDGPESYTAGVIKPRHSSPFRNRDNDGCLEARESSPLLE